MDGSTRARARAGGEGVMCVVLRPYMKGQHAQCHGTPAAPHGCWHVLVFFSGVMAAAPRVTCMQRSAAPLQQQSKPNNKYSLESKMFAVGHTMSNAPDLF